MVIAILLIIGLCLGSFINALVWRLHKQLHAGKTKATTKSKSTKAAPDLSIVHGRSICPKCEHELAVTDLIPVISWLALGGRCRYCRKPISIQYPLVELITAGLFLASYIWWPIAIGGAQTAIFVLWLLLLTGLLALAVYDVRWRLLPNRLIYPLGAIALVQAVIAIAAATQPATAFFNTILGVAVGGGLFYILFQVSAGKWIGGGDVKLGWLLGLIAATPARSLLFIFLAAVGGTILSLPLLANHRLKRDSVIPFGPFLIAALIIVQLFGAAILHWYTHSFLHFS